MKKVSIILLILVMLFMVYPPLLLYYEEGIKAAFSYFAADTFYYLAIANRSMDKTFYTFDGNYPTNGFQPLWQYYLTSMFKILQLTEQPSQILFVFCSSLLSVTIGIGCITLVIYRLTGNLILALISSIPGWYYLLVSHVEPHYGASWSFINGMESSFSILFFGILLYAAVGQKGENTLSYRQTLFISIFLTLIFLSRLEDLFLLGVIALVFPFWEATKQRWKFLILLLVIPTMVLGIYMGYNRFYAGGYLPISGVAKGGVEGFYNWRFWIWQARYNLKYALGSLFPSMQLFDFWVGGAWKDTAWRVLQLGIPVIASLLWLVIHIGKQVLQYRSLTFSMLSYYEKIFTTLCLYVVFKGIYILCSIPWNHQGHWYFTLSIIIFNVLCALLISNMCKLNVRNLKFFKLISFMLLMFFILLIGTFFTEGKKFSGYNNKIFEFWKIRNIVQNNLLNIAPNNNGIIAYEDGIISYSLPKTSVMNGFGLTLDQEAFKSKQQGDLLTIAYQRGFRFITSLTYFHLSNPENLDSKSLANFLQSFISIKNIEEWEFTIVYQEPATHIIFIQFERKQ